MLVLCLHWSTGAKVFGFTVTDSDEETTLGLADCVSHKTHRAESQYIKNLKSGSQVATRVP